MSLSFKLGHGRKGIYTTIEEIHNAVWLASDNRGQKVIIKGVCHSRIHRERDVLRQFQDRAPIRPLIDEIIDPIEPPGIVLRHLQSDLLATSTLKTLSRIEIKHVSRIILTALAILHDNGFVHTDVKPNNVLCNFSPCIELPAEVPVIRFSEVLLADFGSCVPGASSQAQGGMPIGAAMFRSPEANLKLPWGTSTDIWSFGATIMSLFFGNYHLFSPKLAVDHPDHDRAVLERMHIFFGPFPLSYKTLAPRDTLNHLANIMSNAPQRKPFAMIRDTEFESEDKAFLLRVMRLDPRDRPTAQELLTDPWLS